MTDFSPAFINGELVPAISGDRIEAINPATGEYIGSFPRCREEDVERAVSTAKQAFRLWRKTHPRERADMLHKLADAVEADRERLLYLDVIDNGSPIREMAVDIDIGVMYLRYFAGLALELRGDTISTGFDRLNYTLREPYGVVARLIPFNHPLMFALKTIGAPLVAGNTLILKPSEHTSLSALALVEHIEKIFPPGVISIVTGYGSEAGDAIVAHRDVPRIAFIGSDETGRTIQARAASAAVKSVTLELGGKNPIIICPDADRDQAIEGVISGMRFNFQGQACGSTSRLLVPAGIHDEFVEQLVVRIESLRSGQPLDRATDTGAIVNEAQMNKVLRYVDIGLGEGSRLCTGGNRLLEGEFARGYFVRPALFSDVDPGSRLASEEIFGPVLAAIRYDGFENAIEIANNTNYGLSASIYTNDLGVAHRFARDIEAGYVWVNENQRHFPGTPFGGKKDSGIGKEEDPGELDSYSQIKNVHVRFD